MPCLQEPGPAEAPVAEASGAVRSGKALGDGMRLGGFEQREVFGKARGRAASGVVRRWAGAA